MRYEIFELVLYCSKVENNSIISLQTSCIHYKPNLYHTLSRDNSGLNIVTLTDKTPEVIIVLYPRIAI